MNRLNGEPHNWLCLWITAVNRLNGEPHNWLCLWITAVKGSRMAARCVFFLPRSKRGVHKSF